MKKGTTEPKLTKINVFCLIGLNFTRNVLSWLFLYVESGVESFSLLSFGQVSAETRQLINVFLFKMP